MLHLIPAPLHRLLLPAAHNVRHFWRVWRKQKIEGCTVIVTNPRGEVLLLRHSYGPKGWGLLGGGLDRNEAPEAAAFRELREEIGCEATVMTRLGTMAEEISGSPHIAHVFTTMIDAVPVPDQREIVEAKFFPAHSLPEPLGVITRRRLDLWRDSLKRST
ncbi:NUDIX domain-containing protein [Altererythrobacter sp. RZ02]|uniref:NUDIX domain-containing protein n=1 Tax=Pontixanthobacter rizhaonensis TaxID=2730337 RepID=A0A848QNM5_9SPHN|nr:NUDIX domain-containing protein [Pontixanthobacter rizhaonensis]